MRNLKAFENFNNDLVREVTRTEYSDWVNNHQRTSDYDDVLGLFDDKFDLYQYDPSETNYNTYRISQGHSNSALRIHLKKYNRIPCKQDLFILSFDDEWFTIESCFYDSFEDDDYTDIKYFICDSLEGVQEWLNNF